MQILRHYLNKECITASYSSSMGSKRIKKETKTKVRIIRWIVEKRETKSTG